MPALGTFLLLATFVVCSYAATAAVVGARRGSRRLVESGIGAFYLIAALMTIASAVMINAFLTDDFSIRYVSRYSDSVQPLFYKITSYWGGLDGSIMFWVFLLSIFGSIAVAVNRERYRELIPYVVAVVSVGADVLPVPDAGAQQPVRHLHHAGSARRRGAQPAAAELLDGDPPADALHRVRRHDDPVCVRHGGADHRPPRRRLAARRPPLDDVRVAVPLVRAGARDDLGLRGARLGRLLDVGSGRERGAAAVVHRHRVPPFGDGAGAPQHAADLERQPGHPDVLPDDLRHLPDALRHRAVGALVRPQRRPGVAVHAVHGGHPDRELRLGDLPDAAAQGAQRPRLVGVARSRVPGEQLDHAVLGVLRRASRRCSRR